MLDSEPRREENSVGLASSICALGDGSLPASFDGVRSHLPQEWIAGCLKEHGIASVRNRRLPVEQVVWLVVGMGIYRDQPIKEIVRRLNLALPDETGKGKRKVRSLSNGSITPARDKVGEEPLCSLFRITGNSWALESAGRHAWRGLKLFGIDGTSLRLPDSKANREEFEGTTDSAFPLLRLVALVALRSRLVLNAECDGWRTSEMALANRLLPSIPDHSLTVLDRYFNKHGFWHAIAQGGGQERHWLVRAKDNLEWTPIERLGHGDILAEIRPRAKAREEHPGLPEVLRVRVIKRQKPGFKLRILITSLLDPIRFPASEIAQLYCDRWEQEMAYDEIKTETLESCETIRSKSPERVRQEVWGVLTAYNVIRREMEAAAVQLKVEPSRISFRTSLVLIRDLFYWAEVASPGRLPKMLMKLRLDLAQFVLPRRRKRTYPRAVKRPQLKYAVRVHAVT